MSSQAQFDVPAGAVAQVSIIDTGVRLAGLPVPLLLKPGLEGFDQFPPLASWAFLIESSKGDKILFDLSLPPEGVFLPPAATALLDSEKVSLTGKKHIADLLRENNVDPAEIGSIIWSHNHMDHIGDLSTFPKSTELVVGPGFKEALLPGYPTMPDSIIQEHHFEGRAVREVNFTNASSTVKVGAFDAYDFFGDGSLYILNTPGHEIGHISALARTTSNPDSFIFMGGDICHHGAELRPSPHLPITGNPAFPLPDAVRALTSVCPGSAKFHAVNTKRGRKHDEPFFDPALTIDFAKAVQSIKDSQLADAQSNVFYVFAHDMTIEGTVEFYPHSANDWKAKGWREKTLWNFLADVTPAALSGDQ